MKTFAKFLALAIIFLLMSQVNVRAQIQVGDTLSFWSVAYVDWDPGYPIEQQLISAVCNSVGEQSYVFIDTAVSQAPNQDRIDALVAAFDNDYSQNLPPLYGPVPDEFDGDPRVFILIVAEEMWSGYFDPVQQMPDSMVYRLWEKHSSEREIIYISELAFLYNSEHNGVAHELGHMLHWGQDHSPEPPGDPVIYWEDGWIDESFSNFATVYLIEDVTVPGMWDAGAFFAVDPNLPLIYFNSQYSYDQMKLWSTFMYEHYGGADFTSTLIQDQANGIPGVRNTLSRLGHTESFEDTFEHWVLANYLDDEIYQGGRYSYNHFNFPSCHLKANHFNYPTGPVTGNIFSFAAEYIAFYTSSPASISIDFTGDAASLFRVDAILYDREDHEVEGVVSVPLDSLNVGSYYTDDFGTIYDQIIMVVMNVDSSLAEGDSAEYTYLADIEAAGIVDDGGSGSGDFPKTSLSLNQNYPNPFNPSTTISFYVPDGTGENESTNLSIYDVRGRMIRTLIDARLEPGTHKIVWDGRNDRGGTVAAGIYLCTLVSGEMIDTSKMTILK